jgi:endonuclease YncB( thermonuclease family)
MRKRFSVPPSCCFAWAVLALLTTSLEAKAVELRGSARVIDGDTIAIGAQTVRLFGIDAPESRQRCLNENGRQYRCGITARRELQRLIGRDEVVCVGDQRDDYGRLLATCSVNGIEINRRLIESGHAWAFVRYSLRYASTEAMARRSQRGVFAAENTPPWDYRSAAWRAAASTASEDAARECPIKGNVNRKGERIYHMPWQVDYPKIAMRGNPEKRWFCNENEAAAAGWRRASR